MKITKETIAWFKEDEVSSLEEAKGALIADIVGVLEEKFKYSSHTLKRDIKEYGYEIALNNLQWIMASDLMKDSGTKKIKTTYK